MKSAPYIQIIYKRATIKKKKKKVNKKYWARPINSIQEKKDNHSKYYLNNAILVNSLLSNYYSTY